MNLIYIIYLYSQGTCKETIRKDEAIYQRASSIAKSYAKHFPVGPWPAGSQGSKRSMWNMNYEPEMQYTMHRKRIWKQKVAKHVGFGTLLEVEMLKKCTPLWREVHLEVNMYKAHQSRTTFGN